MITLKRNKNKPTLSPKTEKKWDHQAINQAFESLIDQLELLLDQVKLSAFDTMMRPYPMIESYLQLLRYIEKELLSQWQLKATKDHQSLLAYQKRWFFAEIRKSQGLFTLWNLLCEEIWSFFPDSKIKTHPSLWKSIIHYLLFDKGRTEGLKGFKTSEKISIDIPCCQCFRLLYQADPFQVMVNFLNIIEIGSANRPEIQSYEQGENKKTALEIPKSMRSILNYLEKEEDWSGLSAKLYNFWNHNSGGIFSHYPAFIIEGQLDATHRFRGIQPKKWTGFDQLIGLNKIQNRMIKNIEAFLKKNQGQHMLLWGGRGTGKSSSVLALLHKFKNKGLKLVELRQKDLALLPAISEELSQKKEHFLIFIDDLGFSKNDESYQSLKSVMEGSLLQTAENILFVVTANRKDLVVHGDVDERYPEQRQLIDQQRAMDDRFGMKLFFDVPIFQQLKEILFFYADQNKTPYDKKKIWAEFRNFAAINNHDQPSGRTVHQFFTEKSSLSL